MSSFAVITVLVGYFIVLLVISFFTGRKADNQGFFLGNRKSPWYVVAFGMIGASLSGVTFISLPGWVESSQFSYMQMVLGYLVGYLVIATILMPLYYRLNLTSIYTYLQDRFGIFSYKTGASFFLLSRTIGAAFRLFLVANVLQITIFDAWKVPFFVTVIITILLIWLYTFKGGIKTIIWTDTLQTFFMLLAVGVSIVLVSKELNLSFSNIADTISDSNLSQIFFFDDWTDKRFFWKQFLGGAFITIVMTGLDQDMMQKNLSCKNVKDAKKNMFWFSITLVPVNLFFLSLGALLFIFLHQSGLVYPDDANLIAGQTDNLFPVLATRYLGPVVGIFFILGLVAAAYSSADSALTALTTSFTVDIMGTKGKSDKQLSGIRKWVHVLFSIILMIVIMIFQLINDQNVISAIFVAAGYTYGPLLGLYAFGLFTRLNIRDRLVPLITILSPVLTYIINLNSENWLMGYKFGFELLILNGLITFIGLLIISQKKNKKLEVK